MGLLEQVDDHVGSRQLTGGVEVDTDELSKPRRVIIPHGLGITPSLEDGVGLDDLVLKGSLTLLPLSGGADGGEVRDDLLGVLSLSGSRLSCDEDGLVDARVGHALVGGLSHTKDVGPALGPPLANIDLHGAEGVDGETLVRVDGDTEETGVGVDQLVLVPDNGVPENAGVTEEGEVSHVLRAVKFGGVDLADCIRLVDLVLSVDGDDELLAGGEGVILDLLRADTLKVAANLLVGVGNPDALLGVVGLLLLFLSDVLLHLQPW